MSSTTILNSPAAAGVETVICTTPAILGPVSGSAVYIWWNCTWSGGVGSSGQSWGLRRGTAVIAPLIVVTIGTTQYAATANNQYAGCYVDLPGIIAYQQYSLTINNVGGAATITDVALMVAVF